MESLSYLRIDWSYIPAAQFVLDRSENCELETRLKDLTGQCHHGGRHRRSSPHSSDPEERTWHGISLLNIRQKISWGKYLIWNIWKGYLTWNNPIRYLAQNIWFEKLAKIISFSNIWHEIFWLNIWHGIFWLNIWHEIFWLNFWHEISWSKREFSAKPWGGHQHVPACRRRRGLSQGGCSCRPPWLTKNLLLIKKLDVD